MHSDRLEIVARFPDAISAYTLRNALSAEGIPAVIEGAESNTALSYIGSALGGVKVLVPEDVLEEARAVLDKQHQPSVPAEWTCPKCAVQVDAGFAVCWRCGEEAPEHLVRKQPDQDPRDGDRGVASPAMVSSREVKSSVASLMRDPPVAVSCEPLTLAYVEAGIESAWRAAVVGLVLFPGIAHLYSLALLIYSTRLFSVVPQSVRLRCYVAAGIDVFVLSLLVLVLRTLWQ